jgi:hypothetical protein
VTGDEVTETADAAADRSNDATASAVDNAARPAMGTQATAGEGVGVDARAFEYLDKAANLMLVFCAGDATVKATLCRAPLLRSLLQLALEVDLVVVRRKLVTAVRYLSTDADALEPLEAAGAIPRLVAVLGLSPEDTELKQSALTTLYHLCKTNSQCQEQAVVAGLVPHLCTLLSAPPGLLPALSTPLLCALAATNQRVRQVRSPKSSQEVDASHVC